MQYTLYQLAKKMNCSVWTLRTYLDRAEFSTKRKERSLENKQISFEFDENDFNRLNELIYSRRHSRYLVNK